MLNHHFRRKWRLVGSAGAVTSTLENAFQEPRVQERTGSNAVHSL